MEKLKSLHIKRGSIKAQLTIFKDFVSNFTVLDDLKNVDRAKVENLRRRLNRVELLVDQFDEIQDEIELIDIENTEHLEERQSFLDNYFDVTSRASELLSLARPVTPVCEGDDVSVKSGVFNLSKSPLLTNISLPRIPLPKFEGDFTSWRQFYDEFMVAIHNNVALPDCHKLYYLRASLLGEPLNMITALETTDKNYSLAWKILTDRYENKRRIIYNHVHALLNINEIQKESSTNLRAFIDDITAHVQCLKSFEQPVSQWDSVLIAITTSKLDAKSSTSWEAHLSTNFENDHLPTFQEFIEFLNKRQGVLEATQTKISKPSKPEPYQKPKSMRAYTTTILSCPYCKGQHFIQKCEEFLKLSPSDRFQKVKTYKLCTNCLRRGHFISNCQSSNCRICQRKHHTILHLNLSENAQHNPQIVNQISNRDNDSPQGVVASCSSLISTTPQTEVLLATALVNVSAPNGQVVTLRAILDSAAQMNFITDKACKMLNLKRQPSKLILTGITQSTTSVAHNVTVNLSSRATRFKSNITCGVLPKISAFLPGVAIKVAQSDVPPNIKLADPTFSKPGEIDILLGGALYWDLLCIGRIKGTNGLTFHKTLLGWIVTGEVEVQKSSLKISLLSYNSLNQSLQDFWKVDEVIPAKPIMSPDEEYCEDFFKNTTTRAEDGKFVVKYPLKSNVSQLGNSLKIATSRFNSLERKFTGNRSFKTLYTSCVNEYLTAGHAEIADFNDNSFYLPHHAVIKEESSTTKCRVVFDGSCKLEDGIPINKLQYIGPTVQNDLMSILMRFRTHKYVLTADVAKMYRQVWIHPEHQKFQKIIWRDSPEDPLQCLQLKTVTFGMTSAPFLATRCLLELSKLNEQAYPTEARIIREDFYVDDCLTGADSIQELKDIQTSLVNILNQAGFPLRKFRSNHAHLTSNETSEPNVTLTNETDKALGVLWKCSTDEFLYSFNPKFKSTQITKRTILSETAQMFDPMGLLAPVIVLAKITIQQIWKLQLNWDESLPIELHNKWIELRENFLCLNQITIPRYLLRPDANEVELHGFADASEQAYGACLYIKSSNTEQGCSVNLLAAKSRVTPIKTPSIARLELLAATLLAELTTKVKSILNVHINRELYWSDSQIVLAWLQAHPSRWSTFIANRVARIQELTDVTAWHHVSSPQNPADLISRGMSPVQLQTSELWWHGPNFLLESSYPTKNTYLDSTQLPEQKRKINVLIARSQDFDLLIKKYSNLSKIKRIMAWCQRFISNCKEQEKCKRRSGFLTNSETNFALLTLVKLIQIAYFPREYDTLLQGNQVHKKSSLLSLSPFMDEAGLIRVGGRLDHSNFPFDKRHPILLPKHHLTNLIFEWFHRKLLHAGPTLLLSNVRERFWPLTGRNIAKGIIRQCIRCCRFRATNCTNLMGDLPASRITMKPPFSIVGVDYAGPIYIRDRLGRGFKKLKCYVAVFVCFVVKAIHLEPVTSLSSESFLATFRRFVARRGKPAEVYSDNGTNFRGANKELLTIYDQLNRDNAIINNALSEEGVAWHFNPPHAPHMGGLWEAGVKSFKFHLRRVLLDSCVTYEELTTILAQIEAILNSRPLCPLSSNPNDLTALTPAHFLVGRPYTAIADPNVKDVKVNLLNRYQYIQRLQQDFWSRWCKEYVSELQQRYKWQQPLANIEIGSLVLLKEDGLPPAQWKLGRVEAVHYGSDNVVRVADVKCNSGVLRRPIVKLCVLPITPSVNLL